MADLTLTAAQIAVVYPEQAEIYQHDVAETITKGLALYKTSAGKVGIADANGSGTTQFRGVALTRGMVGQAVDLLKRGHVYGFDLSGMAVDDPIYLSNTAGKFATTAGALATPVGRVDIINNSGTYTKVAYFSANWISTLV
jgi:hypothetical protein